MKTELTPQEVAENLNFIIDANMIKGLGAEYGELVESVKQAAADELKITNGELKPEVHSWWFNHGDGSYTCMHCHRRMSKSAYGWPRCPNCGALMDGKDDSYEKEK